MEGTNSSDIDVFIRFMQRVDSGKEDILKPSRIRSVWILFCREPRHYFSQIHISDSQTRALDNALLNWIPRMRNLRELYCRMILTFDQIVCVARHHATTLTKLAIVCNSTELPHVLSSLGQFTVLSDLSLKVARSYYPRAKLVEKGRLPDSIRMLEVIADEDKANSILSHLGDSPLPKLERFYISTHILQDPQALISFMAIHGPKLRIIKLRGVLNDVFTVLYPLTPQLQVLTLLDPYTRALRPMLKGLPLSVEEVIVSMRSKHLSSWALMTWKSSSELVNIPNEHHLSVVKLVSEDPHLAKGTFSWRKAFAGRPSQDRWMRRIRANTGVLKKRGIAILDERAEELADVL
ncbi:hypothetical protein FB567DRAFT_17074 [Paraphoma chrysanthemicola]|uniref:Uncharacterized protein n=1 Tax=Paraphoma chrysanthemicola TaxID=798071 RepID=A0A8K0W3U3_9PLEO|nr:hypothetical protein FB567DRAFT_17074 [Paraphoma chrysanthemicola]